MTPALESTLEGNRSDSADTDQHATICKPNTVLTLPDVLGALRGVWRVANGLNDFTRCRFARRGVVGFDGPGSCLVF
jgi:hypothetical protein